MYHQFSMNTEEQPTSGKRKRGSECDISTEQEQKQQEKQKKEGGALPSSPLYIHVYRVIDLEDSAEVTHARLLSLFEKLAARIQAHLANDSHLLPLNVHINCMHGRNRSITFLLFLLVKLHHMTPLQAFHRLLTTYQQQFGEGTPKFLVSKSVGLRGVAFLDWYAGQGQGSEQQQSSVTGAPRRSSRSQPLSALATAVAAGRGDMQAGYVCQVLAVPRDTDTGNDNVHGEEGEGKGKEDRRCVRYFVSDLKGARRVLANHGGPSSPSDSDSGAIGNPHSIVSVNLSGKSSGSGSESQYQYTTTLISIDHDDDQEEDNCEDEK